MEISENCLIISYDEKDKKIVVRRAFEQEIFEKRAVLHTEYFLSKIKSMTLSTACRLLGEDILISLAGTRTLFNDPASTKKIKKKADKKAKQESKGETSRRRRGQTKK